MPSCLLGRCSATWATFQAINVYFYITALFHILLHQPELTSTVT
jgi:hypothetical protein